MSKAFIIAMVVLVLSVVALLFYPATIRCPGMSRDRHEIQVIKLALEQYHQVYGKYPIGNVEAILAALFGNNDRKIIFLELLTNPEEFNAKGLDPWGTPYNIEIQPDKVLVTCAGPDRTFGTLDDQTTKKNDAQHIPPGGGGEAPRL